MLEGKESEITIAEEPREMQPPSSEIRRQARGNFTTEVDSDLEAAVGEGRIKYVFQKGIGFVDGNDPQSRYIETSDFGGKSPSFGSCVCVVARCPDTKITGVLHADTTTDIDMAMDLIRAKVGTENVEVSVVGGQDGVSEGILMKIRDQVGETSGWQIGSLDILGPKSHMTRQVVVDAFDGRIFNLSGEAATNLKPWGIDLPENIRTRAGMTSVIDKKLIIDIDIAEMEPNKE